MFGGAWVSWSWGSLYVGWAPLDYLGRPGWIGGPYYAGYYDPGCWTFVGYDHIHTRHIPRYAVPIGRVRDDLRHATVVARPPRVDPKRVAESPAWRGRALREVTEDRAARMRPIQTDRRPERKLAEVQERWVKRPSQGPTTARATQEKVAAPSLDRRTTAAKPDDVIITAKRGQKLVPSPEGSSYLGFIFARGHTAAENERALRDAHAELRFEIVTDLPVFQPLARGGT